MSQHGLRMMFHCCDILKWNSNQIKFPLKITPKYNVQYFTAEKLNLKNRVIKGENTELTYLFWVLSATEYVKCSGKELCV